MANRSDTIDCLINLAGKPRWHCEMATVFLGYLRRNIGANVVSVVHSHVTMFIDFYTSRSAKGKPKAD